MKQIPINQETIPDPILIVIKHNFCIHYTRFSIIKMGFTKNATTDALIQSNPNLASRRAMITHFTLCNECRCLI